MDEEFSELYDAEIPRVDLVGKAANGVPRFLIAKNDERGGLVDADTVRELIGKAGETTVTLTGSPAAIMRMIHDSAVSKGRDETPGTDTDPSITKGVTMADDAPDLASEPLLADGDSSAPGSETQPGSPAWETVDAATACKWTAILARARAAIELLADREMVEAAGADPDDAENAWSLDDACCAIDYAIGVLAPYAVAEEAEAAAAAEDMGLVGKALDGYDPAGLDTIEALGRVRKAGKVLSARNEQAIRDAVESLQKVLASLPTPPTDDTAMMKEEGDVPDTSENMTKTEDAPEVETEDVTKQADEAPAEDVAKADGEGRPAQVAVYDAKGKLVGIADPADITPIAGADQADDGEEVVADTPAEPAPDGAQTSDLEPAPAATVGTPADDVAKTTATPETPDEPSNTDADVLKNVAEDVVKAALAEVSAKYEEVIAKQAADFSKADEVVKGLEDRVKALEEQPAVPGVFTNGQVPQHLLRGQDAGGAPVDVTKAAEMRRRFTSSTDTTEQNRIAKEMQASAVAALEQIHRGARP